MKKLWKSKSLSLYKADFKGCFKNKVMIAAMIFTVRCFNFIKHVYFLILNICLFFLINIYFVIKHVRFNLTEFS